MAPPRKKALNERYFQHIDTEEKAYWLGFIAADGCVTGRPRCSLDVSLQQRDRGHLEKLRDALKSTAPINDRITKARGVGYESSRFAVHSAILHDDLARLGITPRKSLTMEPWQGPPDLMRHWWRGMVDGDGCLHFDKQGKWNVHLVGTLAVIQAFSRFVHDWTGYQKSRKATRAGRCWAIQYAGMALPGVITDLLYRNATVYLDRKHETAQRLLVETAEARAKGVQVLADRSGVTREVLVNLALELGSKIDVAGRLGVSPNTLSSFYRRRKAGGWVRAGKGTRKGAGRGAGDWVYQLPQG